MRLLRYLLQYRVKDMRTLIANDKKPPRECDAGMKGKTVVITGATSGIGLETARLFAAKGADLIFLNRNSKSSELLEEELRQRYNCDVQTILLDFNSLSRVKKCAEKMLALDNPLDVIIHNAGVFNTRKRHSEDNIEMVFQVNHLGAFLLNTLLLERLKSENRARILYVNSEGHRFALGGVHLKDLDWHRHLYTGLKSYGAAKTAQLLTMQKFADLFSDTSVTVNAMHPGNVRSNMGNNNGRLYRWMKKKLVLSTALEPEISAKALYFLAASGEMDGVSGRFYNLTTEEKPAPHGRDPRVIEDVWNKSRELCGL